MTKPMTEQEMASLGAYYDEHGDEDWEEAERNGEVFKTSELGCKTAVEATAKLAAMQPCATK
jgi:hypothetical protein